MAARLSNDGVFLRASRLAYGIASLLLLFQIAGEKAWGRCPLPRAQQDGRSHFMCLTKPHVAVLFCLRLLPRFDKVVREKLCELEIPHKFVAAARGSPKVACEWYTGSSWCG